MLSTPIRAAAFGSAFMLDPHGSFTAWNGGTYYFNVRDYFNLTMREGQNYRLHVSVTTTN